MHDLPKTATAALLAALLPALAATLPAQGRNPMEEIQEIARLVDEQLQEIDRLLLESGKQSQARARPKELLQQARERSEAAEGGLERLIEKLQQMKGDRSSSSSSSSQDQQGQSQPQSGEQQQQQSGQGQRTRRENQTPDFVRQPQAGEPQPGEPQPGEGEPRGQPQPTPGQPEPQLGPDGQPLGGQEHASGGQNTRGNRPDGTPTGPGQSAEGDASWGELQPYLNALKNRGSAPQKVPERFRKYWEAYLKQKQGRDGGR